MPQTVNSGVCTNLCTLIVAPPYKILYILSIWGLLLFSGGFPMRVIVCDGEKEIELKMQTDYALDTKVEYKGKIAYLKYSNYLIWYDLDQN